MKRTAIIIMVLTIITKFFGFGREISLSYFYGTSGVSDAYLVALTIPTVIFSFVGMGLYTGYIPLYSKLENECGVLKADKFTSNLVNILMLICTVIIALSFIFAEGLIKIFASGFEGETLRLAVKLTRMSLISIYFTGLIHIFKGYLQIKNMYIVPELMSFPMNTILIITIALSSGLGMEILGLGIVLAIASELLIIIPFIYKNGYSYEKYINFKDPVIHQMVYLALPVIFGVSVNQINVLVDKTIASQIAIGGISALNYANKLNLFIQGILVMSIVTIMYPSMSKMVVCNNVEGLKSILQKAVFFTNVFIIPASIGFIVFSEAIVNLLFGRGAFDANAIKLTSSALLFYSVGMIGYGCRMILSRVFYSMQDTKTPMINASIGVSLNIILNIILSQYMGIGGLALATSIADNFTAILLFVNLRRKIGSFGIKQLGISFLKILFASLFMGVLSKLCYEFLLNSLSQIATLFIAIAVGVLSYFLILYFLKIKDIDNIIEIISRKLRRNAY